MGTMPDSGSVVTGGVDTHRDFHAGAVIDHTGRVLGTEVFPATGAGYRQLHQWLVSHGTLERVGIEGTGSWGAGCARYLRAASVEVVEVIRPNRQHRRRYGKNDPADAVAAARAALSGEADAKPRGGTGAVESLRVLRIARNSAVKQRTAVGNQLHGVIVTAPERLRATLRGLSLTRIITIAVSYQTGDPTDPYQATMITLRSLARRHQTLTVEISNLDGDLTTVVKAAAPPRLLAEPGIGPVIATDLLVTAGEHPHRLHSEASFAALCGSSPVDASSGLQQRHRLNRGGDRQANAALYRAVIVRLRYHQPTRDYMTRRLAQGKTRREIIRCLKRALARRIYHLLTQPPPTA